ncbi:28615_t:CDS:1 [Dentiscutata erythropus]|uniref:28615_t:CDS:1 n=1 Tax=Dentiscutata erythropus TaxID=1348616 RepID=A0A9N9JIK6_9GLOM|nr:28615_t:CDS:1 [Dentiscutata erythropus]
MSTSYLKSYYRKGSTLLTSEQIETIRTLKGKVPKYRIIRDFHINENRVKDIWGSHERQQQIIQSDISSEILPIPVILPKNSNRIEGEILLQSKPEERSKDHGSLNLHLKSTTPPNTEIKKRSSKSKSKSVRISDPIPSSSSILVNIDHASSTDNLTKKISGDTMNGDIFNTDIVTQIEREIKRKDKNLVNTTRIGSTT